MKFLFVLLVLIALPSSPTKAQKIHSYKSSLTGDSVKYAVYLPPNYSPKEKYPLLVFLHGMSEKTWPVGSFNPAVKKVGLPKLLESGLKIPFIVIVPNCAYSDWDNIGYTKDYKIKFHSPGALPVEVSQMAKKVFPVDTTRIYITGISMGGGGAFSAVQYYPHAFAAAIPIAGWGNNSKACQTITPLWVFQGSKDNGEGVKSIIDAIKNCHPQSPSICTILEGKGHNVWDETYENKASKGTDIYKWLLNFKL